MRDTRVMDTGTPPRAADGARLGTALTRRAVINAATQAYLRGEVQRLVVVAGRGQDGPPAPGNRLFGLLGR